MLCIRAGASLLAAHCRDELDVAQKFLESAITESSFATELAPRLKSLQEQALSAISITGRSHQTPHISPAIVQKLSAHGMVAPSVPPRQQSQVHLEHFMPVNTPVQAATNLPATLDSTLGSVVAPESYYNAMMQNSQPSWYHPVQTPLLDRPVHYYPPNVPVSQQPSPNVVPMPYADYQAYPDYFQHLVPQQQDRLQFDNTAGFGTGVYDQLISGMFI